jgi:pyruvate,water dikinase
MANYKYILFFNQIGIDALAKLVKNASLGEMYNQLNPIGIAIPNGFALTAEVPIIPKENNLEQPLQELLFH